MADLGPADIARRRSGKLFNERLKLAAGFMNTGGIATLVGAYLVPYVSGRGDVPSPTIYQAVTTVGYASALHLAGQLILSLYRSED